GVGPPPSVPYGVAAARVGVEVGEIRRDLVADQSQGPRALLARAPVAAGGNEQRAEAARGVVERLDALADRVGAADDDHAALDQVVVVHVGDRAALGDVAAIECRAADLLLLDVHRHARPRLLARLLVGRG